MLPIGLALLLALAAAGCGGEAKLLEMEDKPVEVVYVEGPGAGGVRGDPLWGDVPSDQGAIQELLAALKEARIVGKSEPWPSRAWEPPHSLFIRYVDGTVKTLRIPQDGQWDVEGVARVKSPALDVWWARVSEYMPSLDGQAQMLTVPSSVRSGESLVASSYGWVTGKRVGFSLELQDGGSRDLGEVPMEHGAFKWEGPLPADIPAGEHTLVVDVFGSATIRSKLEVLPGVTATATPTRVPPATPTATPTLLPGWQNDPPAWRFGPTLVDVANHVRLQVGLAMAWEGRAGVAFFVVTALPELEGWSLAPREVRATGSNGEVRRIIEAKAIAAVGRFTLGVISFSIEGAAAGAVSVEVDGLNAMREGSDSQVVEGIWRLRPLERRDLEAPPLQRVILWSRFHCAVDGDLGIAFEKGYPCQPFEATPPASVDPLRTPTPTPTGYPEPSTAPTPHSGLAPTPTPTPTPTPPPWATPRPTVDLTFKLYTPDVRYLDVQVEPDGAVSVVGEYTPGSVR